MANMMGVFSVTVRTFYVGVLIFGLASIGRAEIAGYTYHGRNVGYLNQGQHSGGYFLLDRSALPTVTYSPEYVDGPNSRGEFPMTPGLSSSNHPSAYYRTAEVHAAFDDDLSDLLRPGYATATVAGIDGGFDRDIYSFPDARPRVFGSFGYGYIPFNSAATFGSINFGTDPRSTHPDFLTNPTQSLGQAYDSNGPIWSVRAHVGLETGRERFLEISYPTISPFSIQDVFNNPQTLQMPRLTHNNVQIEAEFTPHIQIAGSDVPMAIDAVAALMGVHHFNWLQSVTLAAGWTVRIDQDGQLSSTNDRSNDVQPAIDPNDRGSGHYLITNPPGVSEILTTPAGVDTLPYYLDEGNATGPWAQRNNQFTSKLTFSDWPHATSTLNPNLEYTNFRTELVGVRADGSYVQTGSGFTWRSNTTYSLGGGIIVDSTFRSAIDGVTVLPAFQGGISDVAVFHLVPEPCTAILAIVMAHVLPVLFRRRHFLVRVDDRVASRNI
jgi:hypothetical protein